MPATLRLRPLWRIAALLVPLIAAATIGWIGCITPAAVYRVQAAIEPRAAVMSMSDYGRHGDHARPYILQIAASPGMLLMYGAEHTQDPAAPDIASLRETFESFRPTVVLVESRLGWYFGGFDAAVRRFGESGAAGQLARARGVPLYTLELPLEQEVAGVLAQHPAEQVALFYVLRPYFGQRRHGPVADPDGAIAEPLAKRTRIAGLQGTLKSVADVDRVWRRDFPGLPDWRDCDDRYGWPGALAEIGATANDVRNQHWIQVIAELVGRGERVFAVCGASHAVRLEAALRETLAAGKP
jgi:hypothetical protein